MCFSAKWVYIATVSLPLELKGRFETKGKTSHSKYNHF